MNTWRSDTILISQLRKYECLTGQCRDARNARTIRWVTSDPQRPFFLKSAMQKPQPPKIDSHALF